MLIQNSENFVVKFRLYFLGQLLDFPLVKNNIKRQKDADLNEKSALLKTIRLNKNLSYIGNNLPKPNY